MLIHMLRWTVPIKLKVFVEVSPRILPSGVVSPEGQWVWKLRRGQIRGEPWSKGFFIWLVTILVRTTMAWWRGKCRRFPYISWHIYEIYTHTVEAYKISNTGLGRKPWILNILWRCLFKRLFGSWPKDAWFPFVF